MPGNYQLLHKHINSIEEGNFWREPPAAIEETINKLNKTNFSL
jgi:hypothetical protein